MTKSFSKLYSDFWTNYDNSEVVGLGMDAQLMALYLQGNSHRNIFGVYYLPLLYISSDLKLSVKKVKTSLDKLCKINYCKYDEKIQHVWVCNLAFEQIGEEVDIKDNRIKALQEIWRSLPSKLEFLEEVYQKYGSAFYLEPRIFAKPSKYTEGEDVRNERIENSDEVVTSAGTNTTANINVTDAITTPIANIDISNTDIQTSAELLSPFLVSSEIPFDPKQSRAENNSIDIFKEDVLGDTPPLIHSLQTSSETFSYMETSGYLPCSPVLMQASSDFINNEGACIILTPSEGLGSPSEGPLEPLRSNIEDRSKNIEVRSRSKKEEVEVEKEEREKKYYGNFSSPSIVAQARPDVGFAINSPDKNFSFLGKAEEQEKAAEAETKQLPQVVGGKDVMQVAVKPIPKSPKTKAVNLKNNTADTANPVNSVVEVFEHWKHVMEHPGAKIDDKRKVLISQALRSGYSVQQLCDAITGCSYTPFNTGDNDRGQRYDGLHIILRNADQIDRFIRNYHNPPKPVNDVDRMLSGNLNVAREWADSKRNEMNVGKGDIYV